MIADDKRSYLGVHLFRQDQTLTMMCVDRLLEAHAQFTRNDHIGGKIMGIFGDDKMQDERLNALEIHIRALTETVLANQVDLAGAWIAIISLQAQIDEKVSAEEIDPTIGALNKQLGEARGQLAKASDAASESWATMQDGVRDSFETLRGSVREASERLKQG